MRPLSEVFAPGAPTLPERLRTLVVSPERELEPGMTVRATFTFRNQGGAPATGVRLRFNMPEGLIYLVGSGCLDGKEADDELGNSPLLSRGGADIGDVAAGEERRIEIAYSVAGAIENGTTVELQAALASFELPPVGSNVVRLVVRSKPQLWNALTRIAIEGAQDPRPGSQAQVTIRIHNAGQSSAHDVIVVAPIPEHASYLAGSARVNGREIERDLMAPFDRTHAPVVVRSLAANASAVVTYRIALDAPLPDGAQVVARARIGSQETPAFELEAAALTVVSSPNLNDERTMLRAAPSHGVRPGQRITLSLTAQNAGSATAERVHATVELPEALIFVRGASTIDDRPVRERRKETMRFSLGSVEAGESVTLRADAIVAAPLPNGTMLTPAATLEWEPGSPDARRLECTVTVHSEPDFPPRRNGIERRGAAAVRPGDALEATVSLANDGSAAANDGVLHLRLEPALDELAVFDGATRLSIEGDTLELGTLDAYASRKLTLRARVASPCSDRTELRIAASLHTRELGETPLREAFWRVDSHPAFRAESSRLELSDESVLRPNQLAQIDVIVTNAGTDTAHNVALRLYVSPEARLESVDGATREKSSLIFGELAPGARARARLGLRLLRSLAKEYPVTIDAVLTADAVLPVPLTPLTIATAAEPDFSVGRLSSRPEEAAEAGETVEWTLQLRNGGDGVAHHVAVTIGLPDSLIYVPNSTSVNDLPVRDAGALPPFSAEGGISLNEVDPGVEPTIRWLTVVHNALHSGTPIVHVAHVRYDGERDDEIVSPEIVVRSGPVFATAIPGLPFGLDGLLGAAPGSEPRAITEDRFLELPPATPVSDGNGAPYLAQLAAASPLADGTRTATLATFAGDRVTRTLRFLREARFGGLVWHLFALRAFLPDAIGDAHRGALDALRDVLREEFDRLFIKLRLPRYTIVPRDIETPSLRAAIDRLLDEAASARGVPPEPPITSIELRGSFSGDELHALRERVTSSELASAPPWAALARLLPDETAPYAEYRGRLIERLESFAGSEAVEFVEALQREQDSALDGALDAMCASLHAIA
ncbi:MAG TPA: hypothetical protein VGG70_07985 [Candidatus Cybelea sp.]